MCPAFHKTASRAKSNAAVLCLLCLESEWRILLCEREAKCQCNCVIWWLMMQCCTRWAETAATSRGAAKSHWVVPPSWKHSRVIPRPFSHAVAFIQSYSSDYGDYGVEYTRHASASARAFLYAIGMMNEMNELCARFRHCKGFSHLHPCKRQAA